MVRASLAALVGAFLLMWASPAMAQACCAASELRSPSRLGMGQMWSVGLMADAQIYSAVFAGTDYRSLDDRGHELRQTPFVSRRLGDDWQVAASLPLVQNRRQNGQYSEWGGGIGDLTAMVRYEVVAPGMSATWPGIALSASAVLPTGRSPSASMERGESALQSDVTGRESARFDLGGDVAWSGTTHFAAVDVGIYQALPFTDGRGDTVLPGVGSRASLSVGRSLGAPLVWDETVYLSLGLGLDRRGSLRAEGRTVADSREFMTHLAIAAGAYLTETLYLSVHASWHIPLDYFGENRLAGPRAGLVLKRIFYDL